MVTADYAGCELRILAEARDPETAVILLDVVMETDDAGIALVQHIREQQRNIDMQIVLRTGQPGVAPESDIMRRYEINGYFVNGAQPYKEFKRVIDIALKEAK